MKASKIKIVWAGIDDVQQNPTNPRTITEEKMQELMTSIEKFPKMMEYRPIVADRKTGNIIGGNQRHTACKRLGWKTVPVVYVQDMDEKKLREFILKDNLQFGEWDFSKLKEFYNQDQLLEWGLDDAKFVSFFDPDGDDTENKSNGDRGEPGTYDENVIKKIQFNLTTEEYDNALEKLSAFNQRHGFEDNSQALIHLIGLHDNTISKKEVSHIDFKIAIPSFKRKETLLSKTLSYLNECNIPDEKIYIFTANKDEFDEYKEHIGGKYNYEIGLPTLRAQRNFIQNFFTEGDVILNMDDDLDGLYRKSGKEIEKFFDLQDLATRGAIYMKKNNAKIFGVYPVANGFFMKERVTTGLKYIVGCFWGCIIDHSELLSVELEDKEDFERTIKYFHEHKSVIRIENICVKTNYYKEQGGMQETRTKERVEYSARFLADKYPMYAEINNSKKNKEFAEIKLKNI